MSKRLCNRLSALETWSDPSAGPGAFKPSTGVPISAFQSLRPVPGVARVAASGVGRARTRTFGDTWSGGGGWWTTKDLLRTRANRRTQPTTCPLVRNARRNPVCVLREMPGAGHRVAIEASTATCRLLRVRAHEAQVRALS